MGVIHQWGGGLYTEIFMHKTVPGLYEGRNGSMQKFSFCICSQKMGVIHQGVKHQALEYIVYRNAERLADL